jgi:hypothetical protein
VLREQQHQVDVGGEVELAAAELAHRNDEQRLQGTARPTRLAVALHQRTARVPERTGDRRIREARQIGECLPKIREAGQVPPGDARQLAPPPAAQLPEQLGLLQRPRGGRRAARAEFGGGEAAQQVVVGDELLEQCRIARQRAGYEVTGGEDRAERIADGRRGGGERGARAVAGVELCERVLDEAGELRADRGLREIGPLRQRRMPSGRGGRALLGRPGGVSSRCCPRDRGRWPYRGGGSGP